MCHAGRSPDGQSGRDRAEHPAAGFAESGCAAAPSLRPPAQPNSAGAARRKHRSDVRDEDDETDRELQSDGRRENPDRAQATLASATTDLSYAGVEVVHVPEIQTSGSHRQSDDAPDRRHVPGSVTVASQAAGCASRTLCASTRATCSASRPVPSAIWWRHEVPSATISVSASALRTAGSSDSSPMASEASIVSPAYPNAPPIPKQLASMVSTLRSGRSRSTASAAP